MISNMKNIARITPGALLLLPLIASAQFGGTSSILLIAADLINSLIIIVGAIALLVFLWGLAKFIMKVGGDEKAVADGKRLMIWGLVALFVMVSVWGLVNLIGDELIPGLDNSAPRLPGVPQP